MSTRQIMCAILTVSMVLGLFSAATVQWASAMSGQQDQEEDNVKELIHQIRRDKFDIILPKIMRDHKIDMWIHVMRDGTIDPMSDELGGNNGVFVFTDRGGDRIERAVIGHRWESPARRDIFGRIPYVDVVRECGAYDIIAEEFSRREMPGGPKTELDYRFNGVGEFVAERDPKRIGVNYLEEMGLPVEYELPRERPDGISYTDYKLLVKALGEKYAKRLVSSEYLVYDYLSQRVPSEIEMFKKIREWSSELLERDYNKIVPGVTKLRSLVTGGFARNTVDGNRKRGDYVIKRGDLIQLLMGRQSHHFMDPEWKFGNFYEDLITYGYVLHEGETEPPPKIKRAWADALKVRKILEDNIKVGRTAGATLEILKRKIEDAGFIYVNRQIFNKDLDPGKTQVPLDLHAAGKGNYAPRIAPLGPDWQRDLILPPNHHFYFEYWVYVPMPEWGEGRYLSLQFHDGAMVTERGVEYFAPPPTELHIIH